MPNDPPPGPQPPRPSGCHVASGAEIDDHVVSRARAALAGQIGDRSWFDHDGRRYCVQLEHHYHPPGGPAKPWGWHKGATVYVQDLDLLCGIDISAWQTDLSVPWTKVAERCAFVFCRATYGTKRDRMVAEHVRRVRGLGLKVGLYHFWRPDLSIDDQLAAFGAAADAVELGPGDLIPAFDLEADTAARPLKPSDSEPARQAVEQLVGLYGECLVYITHREWRDHLGSPAWVLERPLWVAHWTSAKLPTTPGDRPWRIWQYSVGPFNPDARQRDPENSRALDHDYALAPLPLIPESAQPVATIDPATIPWVNGRGDDWLEDFRRSRDALRREDEP